MAQIPLDRIHSVAQAYFQERLTKALELCLDLPSDVDVDLNFEIQGSLERISALKSMMKKHRYDDSVELDARALLEKTGNEGPADDALTYIRRLVARAMILQNEYLVQELSGGTYNGAPDDSVFRGIGPGALPEDGDIATDHDLSIRTAIESFMALKDTVWVPKTKADYKRCLLLASDVIGADRPLSSVKADDIRKVRDVLMSMPANAFKTYVVSGQSLKKIITDNADGSKLAFKTREKYFTMIRTFFKWAVDEEKLAQMPGKGIKLVGGMKEAEIEERDPYSKDELLKIFSSPLYAGSKSFSRRYIPGTMTERDDYFWIPIVALYTGMRLGEIVQLRLTDLKSEDGVPYFNVSLDGDKQKTVKTAQSIRRVPVHPILISLGLLTYAAAREKANRQRLFDDIKPSKTGYYSANFSKWWGRYSRKITVHTDKTAFHSFRHNFTDALREAEVADDVSRQLTGHADKPGDSHARYGTKASLKRLREGIIKISYGSIDDLLNKV
ncbi:integrase [Pseudochrobactrum saccharolyticum]|uniref:Integrase n=1 Tax=Pseudochrobactrum saccharolyticum TaxID=354352 RepID=A0A7W8ER50_9HYPH|nr:site-specific integrase [Pseudochrobactrum saccharolyticum]MBB5092596.1 integrase [Pseudochrobactrum saccharolyticum]